MYTYPVAEKVQKCILSAMRLNEFLTKQKELNITIFNKEDVKYFLNLDDNSAQKIINRYLKNGYFAQLKKGLYYMPLNKPDPLRVANYLYQPSYISLETALSRYQIILERVYTITSVTSKTPKEYTIDNLVYTYKSIKMEAFTGYHKHEGLFIAYPEKALADYLYYVSLGRSPLLDRIYLQGIDKTLFYSYVRIFKSKTFESWIDKNYDRLSRHKEVIY